MILYIRSILLSRQSRSTMMAWKIIQTLSADLAPVWEGVTNESLGESTHPRRKTSYALSREAIRQLLLEQGHQVSPGDIKLIGFNKIINFPQYSLSLTHSIDVGAAVLASQANYLAVGIDLENKDRKVSSAIRERIVNKEDASLTNIELWCAKEAVFKCLMNSGQFEQTIDFMDIVIKEDEWLHPESGLRGRHEFHLEDPYIINLAYLENTNSSRPIGDQ
ncbi:MAG: 4'-phosphopantetheinyl transferase superfamily protein [Bacteriovoracaceae bacterium]